MTHEDWLEFINPCLCPHARVRVKWYNDYHVHEYEASMHDTSYRWASNNTDLSRITAEIRYNRGRVCAE